MKDVEGIVSEIIHIGQNIYIIGISLLEDIGKVLPGQFVNILISTKTFSPFLRRPFSVFTKTNNSIKILVKEKGVGTSILVNDLLGEKIKVLGPLGNSWLDVVNISDGGLTVAGGGVGFASFRMLLDSIRLDSNYENLEIKVLIGLRGKIIIKELVGAETYKRFFVRVASSDMEVEGWEKGTLTDLIAKYHEWGKHKLLLCAPVPALKDIYQKFRREMEEYKEDIFLSLESVMGCGFGLCNGCVVKASDGGYKKVCTDGPIFPLKKIDIVKNF